MLTCCILFGKQGTMGAGSQYANMHFEVLVGCIYSALLPPMRINHHVTAACRRSVRVPAINVRLPRGSHTYRYGRCAFATTSAAAASPAAACPAAPPVVPCLPPCPCCEGEEWRCRMLAHCACACSRATRARTVTHSPYCSYDSDCQSDRGAVSRSINRCITTGSPGGGDPWD